MVLKDLYPYRSGTIGGWIHLNVHPDEDGICDNHLNPGQKSHGNIVPFCFTALCCSFLSNSCHENHCPFWKKDEKGTNFKGQWQLPPERVYSELATRKTDKGQRRRTCRIWNHPPLSSPIRPSDHDPMNGPNSLAKTTLLYYKVFFKLEYAYVGKYVVIIVLIVIYCNI